MSTIIPLSLVVPFGLKKPRVTQDLASRMPPPLHIAYAPAPFDGAGVTWWGVTGVYHQRLGGHYCIL